jgi:chemotaxis protein CheY-P-specific phosphatase CheC
MLNNLKENEVEVATKLINDGLAMAKTSMEQILQSPITLKKVDFGIDKEDVSKFRSDANNVNLIKTELLGELKGSCFLVFSESDVEKINKKCLPVNILEDDSEESKMMMLGFLTEIDNMVAAAVITEFANFLGVDIFGNVPSLHVLAKDKVNDFLAEETTSFDSVIHFKALFKGEELDISPDFIWIFNEKFMDKIKEVL